MRRLLTLGKPFPLARQQRRPPRSLLLEIADQGEGVGGGRNEKPLLEIAQEGLYCPLAGGFGPNQAGEGTSNGLAGFHPCRLPLEEKLLDFAQYREALLEFPERAEAALESAEFFAELRAPPAQHSLVGLQVGQFLGKGLPLVGEGLNPGRELAELEGQFSVAARDALCLGPRRVKLPIRGLPLLPEESLPFRQRGHVISLAEQSFGERKDLFLSPSQGRFALLQVRLDAGQGLMEFPELPGTHLDILLRGGPPLAVGLEILKEPMEPLCDTPQLLLTLLASAREVLEEVFAGPHLRLLTLALASQAVQPLLARGDPLLQLQVVKAAGLERGLLL